MRLFTCLSCALVLLAMNVAAQSFSMRTAQDQSPNAMRQADGQNQLVLLRHERVFMRYRPGSLITYKKKRASEYLTSLIIEVREFSIVTNFDTLLFSDIERVSLKGKPNSGANNIFGSLLLVGGATYFLLDQANSVIVHGQGYDNDPAVWKPALIMVASGLALKQIHRRSLRLRFPAKLLSAAPGTSFFEKDE